MLLLMLMLVPLPLLMLLVLLVLPPASAVGLSLPGKSSENLEKVPRIWEGEGSRRSEILNPINNDYWVYPKENPGNSW